MLKKYYSNTIKEKIVPLLLLIFIFYNSIKDDKYKIKEIIKL